MIGAVAGPRKGTVTGDFASATAEVPGAVFSSACTVLVGNNT